MPNEKAQRVEAAPATTPNKSKRALIIILAAIALSIVGVCLAVIVMLKSSQDDYDDDEDSGREVKTLDQKKLPNGAPPIFAKLDKFTVNLRPADDGSNGDSYMQADITLQVDSPDVDARLKSLMPRIRNDVTFIMSDKQADSLMSREGKESLAAEIRDAINSIINPYRRSDGKPADGPVKDVLFESIIIQ